MDGTLIDVNDLSFHGRQTMQDEGIMRIITNHHERQFLYGYDVPSRVHDEYDHLTEDERMDGWLYYRGSYYHESDFFHTGGIHELQGEWDGYLSDTYFSGVAIAYRNDGHEYVICRFMV